MQTLLLVHAELILRSSLLGNQTRSAPEPRQLSVPADQKAPAQSIPRQEKAGGATRPGGVQYLSMQKNKGRMALPAMLCTNW
jgi:hypothetical protein